MQPDNEDTEFDTVSLLTQDPSMLALNTKIQAQHVKILAHYLPPEGTDPAAARHELAQKLERNRKAQLRYHIATRAQHLPTTASYVDPSTLSMTDQSLVIAAINGAEGALQALEEAHCNYLKTPGDTTHTQWLNSQKDAVHAFEKQLLNQYAPQVYREAIANDDVARRIAESYLKKSHHSEAELIAELTAKAKDAPTSDSLKYLRFVFDGTWEEAIAAHLNGTVQPMAGKPHATSGIPYLRGIIEFVIADRTPPSLAYALQPTREATVIAAAPATQQLQQATCIGILTPAPSPIHHFPTD